jgi:hypothetical protein
VEFQLRRVFVRKGKKPSGDVMKKSAMAVALFLVLGSTTFLWSEPDGRTINIHFEDRSKDGPTMQMSLPLSSLVASIVPQLNQALVSIQEESGDVDFQAIWRQIENEGPTDWVAFNGDEAGVWIATTRTHLLVRVHEKTRGEQINVSIPLVLGDALFQGAEVDFESLVEVLESTVGQDLVSITSSTVKARVWVE